MEPWGTVVTYWCEGIAGCRWMVYARQPEHYVRRVAENVSKYMELLVQHYAEEVNGADLDHLHASFGTDPYPQDGWRW